MGVMQINARKVNRADMMMKMSSVELFYIFFKLLFISTLIDQRGSVECWTLIDSLIVIIEEVVPQEE